MKPIDVATIGDETDKHSLIYDNKCLFGRVDGYFLADVTASCIPYYEIEAKDTQTQRLGINMRKILDMQNGAIYKMSIAPMENMKWFLGEERLNLYLYVTSEKVYRMWSYVRTPDGTIEFYNDDQLLIQTLDTEDKIINNSYVVWQKEVLLDSLEEEEIGVHHCFEIEDAQIKSRIWEVTDNGETYFYESFLWTEDKGLVAYRSGFRSEREVLYLENIVLCDVYEEAE